MQVGIGEESVVVPSALLTCGWWLTAFYPNDVATEPCTAADLDVVATERAVVVRNGSARPCRLAAPTVVDGEPVEHRSPSPATVDLYAGDVVAVGHLADGACDGVAASTVRFGADAVVEVAAVPCGVVFDSAAPRPWYGAPDGPASAFAGDADLADVLDALDPFGSRA